MPETPRRLLLTAGVAALVAIRKRWVDVVAFRVKQAASYSDAGIC